MQPTELFFLKQITGALQCSLLFHTILYALSLTYRILSLFSPHFQYLDKFFFAPLSLFTYGVFGAADYLGYLRRRKLDHKVVIDDLTVFAVKEFYGLDEIIVPRPAAYLVDKLIVVYLLRGVGDLCVIFLAHLLMSENAYRPVFDRLQHIVFKILGIIDPVKDIHVRRSNAAKDIVDGVLGVFIIIQYGLCEGDHLLSVMPISLVKEFCFILRARHTYMQCKHQ